MKKLLSVVLITMFVQTQLLAQIAPMGFTALVLSVFNPIKIQNIQLRLIPHITNELNIKQSTKKAKFEENKEGHYSGGVSVGNNSVQISASASESASRTISSNYNNSEVQAANIIINANNAAISGANVSATNDLSLDIKNNLTIESIQDSYYSKGNSWGVNASIGIWTGKSAGSNSIGGGFNIREGDSIEIKNYNLENPVGQNNLINNVMKQVKERIKNLPENTKQKVNVDTRGQNVPQNAVDKIVNRIKSKSDTNIDIEFK